jgi:thiosulfate/3-mercaptopyruvate sulfurtransferase
MFKTIIDCSSVKEDDVKVDCRFRLNDPDFGKLQYAINHIEGAFYAHLDADLSDPIVQGHTGRHPLPAIEKMETLFSGFGITPGKQVVVYDDMGGAIAARLWWLLKWVGHEEVAVLNGGFAAWVDWGGQLSTIIPSVKEGNDFKARPNYQMLVEAHQFERKVDDAFCLVDCRTEERYLGIHEPIDPIAGHIPGAVNLPHHIQLDTRGFWKSPEEVKQNFEKLDQFNLSIDRAFYCGSGVTACFNILAMEYAGLGRGKLYAGSWSHWITDSNRPIVS